MNGIPCRSCGEVKLTDHNRMCKECGEALMADIQANATCVRMTKPQAPRTHDSKKSVPPKSYLRDV